MWLNLDKVKKLIEQKTALIALIFISLYVIFFISISIWKYHNFGYNAIDLGIFNQVFYNTSVGDLFSMTIHPHSYLGDHFGLIILLLTPVYVLFRSPVTLLILQTIAIGFSAWPLYLIAKKIANNKIGLLMVVIFLLNPFVQNMNLFEFHLLPFAIFTLLFTFYFYLNNRFNMFLLFSLLSLLVREDISLVIIMFSFLALFDKKDGKWIITPALLGVGWLATVFWIVPLFNNYDSYKFVFYYSWLGGSIGEITKNFFLRPLQVLSHLFSVQNIFMSLALFLPFLLLPFLKPKYLLLSLLVFLQLLLGSFSGQLILKTHYSAPLLVSIFISTIYALTYLFKAKNGDKSNWQFRVKRYISKELALFSTIFIAVTIYGATTFGPIVPAIQAVSSYQHNYPEFGQLKTDYIDLVPENTSVTASYDLLPHLSSRNELYSLHYAFLGRKQYSNDLYTLPPTDFMLIDTKDFLTYQIQYPDNSFYQNAYSEGDNNIRSVMEKQGMNIYSVSDDLLLLSKNTENNIELYTKHSEKPNIDYELNAENKANRNLMAAPEIIFNGWEFLPTNPDQHPTFNIPFSIIPISLYWQTNNEIAENYQLLLHIRDDENNLVYEKYYPLGYGIFPSSEWGKDSYIQTNYWFFIPETLPSTKINTISFDLVQLKKHHHYLGLDGLLTATMKNVEYESVGETIQIPWPEKIIR